MSTNFRLEDFFPYQARKFYQEITRSVSQLYVKKYAMKPDEWRSMAILGEGRPLSSIEIAKHSNMDKVAVSRAITRLRKRSWIVEHSHSTDKRYRLIQLSESGKKIYYALVPQMLQIEKTLLEGLSKNEQKALRSFMNNVRHIASNTST